MSDERPISKLENRLEQAIEGMFANLFRRGVSVHDIALKLARSMETNLAQPQGDDRRLIAPDEYVIAVHGDIQRLLETRRDSLASILSNHLVDLAATSGYRLLEHPRCKLIGDNSLNPSQVIVHSRHSNQSASSTEAMQPIAINKTQKQPQAPQLIINGSRTVHLTQSILNIGRSDSNDIIIDDAFLSRHHVQLRMRHNSYTLFDVHSRSGTYVNGVRVREHRLQPGDVIEMGKTHLIYVSNDPGDGRTPGTTASLSPLDEP